MELLTGVPVSGVKSPSEHEDNLGGGGYKILVKNFLRGELCAKASTALVR